ncbi:MAG: ABC transporter permease [Acholeplasmataceae bacterium]
MRVYVKLLFRTLKSNLTRFIVLISIVAIGVGLSTGIGILPNQLRNSFGTYFEEQKYPSFIIKTTNPFALGETLAQLENSTSVKEVNGLVELDQIDQTRTYVLDLQNQTVNKLKLVKGRLPENANEIVVEQNTNVLIDYELNTTITYTNSNLGMFDETLEVVGIVQSPLFVFRHGIPTNSNPEVYLKRIIYFDQNTLNAPFITDLHVYIETPAKYHMFSNNYREYVKNRINEIQLILNDEELIFIEPNDTIGYYVVQANIDKMVVLSFIAPVFFTFVIMIVVISSMSRLIEDERTQVGTMLSIGISSAKINFRYYFFGITASLIGSVLGIVLGYNTLARLIYVSFGGIMVMPARTPYIHLEFGLIVSAILLAVMVLSVLIASVKQTKEKPAALLRHKTPKAGGKIILEKITPIWKRIKFTYKSTLRNLFRYPLHFVMTVVSVMGATALIFAGVGIYDNTQVIDVGFAKPIEFISVLIILAAAGLSILVTYNLTNMNIEERKREIATLKVLGYFKQEVRNYIFREVFIVASIGILLGLPLGYYLIGIILKYLEIGHVDDINWYSWFIVVLISLLFIGITDLLLFKKIDNIDMSTSLKTID